MGSTEAEIKRWEEIVRDREDIAVTLSSKLIEFLKNFKENSLSPLTKDTFCPIKLSWKPSEKALKAEAILNETISKLSDIL